MPPVNRLYTALKAKGLEVRLISVREKPETVKQALQARGYVAPVLLDESGDVSGRGYGVWGPPTAYFIDRQGRLLARMVGAHDWSTPAVRKVVEDLLAER